MNRVSKRKEMDKDSFTKVDLIFMCRKCEHHMKMTLNTKDENQTLLWVGHRLDHFSSYDCPECGEEPYENWIFKGVQFRR